jgi:hypothetical protein
MEVSARLRLPPLAHPWQDKAPLWVADVILDWMRAGRLAPKFCRRLRGRALPAVEAYLKRIFL